MVRDDLYITIPAYFRCPISLDVMKSPVSLSTGVTYDRSSIQRWLDGGNNTCPATMQVLQSKELIPNHTLQRLIKIWSDSVLTRPPNSPTQSLTREHAAQLVHHLHTDLSNLHKHFVQYSSLIARNLSALTSFADESEENRKFLAAVGGRILQVLVSVIGKVRDLNFLEKIILFCNVLLNNLQKTELNGLKSKIEIEIENVDFQSSILLGLKQGRPELRIAAAKFLDLLASNLLIEFNSFSIGEDEEFHLILLRLISTSNPESTEIALNLLTHLAQLKRFRSKIVRAAGVTALAAALEAEMNAASTEKVLKLLEMATGSKEGRSQICADERCIKAVVKKVLKVSAAATEHAVTVLWSLCCLFGEKRTAAAVAESNGMGKILVVMQSDCSPAVRRMCGDLLRVLRGSCKKACVSWYDTKTTHIMPF